ncbi:DUF2200 family protein [Streptococcus porcinus]|uniref:Lin0147 n=1 Tax=Streptococcus porcinus str. Jelinkova 176 TaxID=873448 RepID=A0ABN0CY09_STRPO|nr:DUF2200 family protein [Streptococcus porcinus]EGJ28213.1 hypothetical protein STRPO_1550 [Streptococcus porcinus str. Jelinkova 176]SQG42468.1 Lin0147 [Streptococcus porcinus]
MSHSIFQMAFQSVYQALVAKVERKGGHGQDVDRMITWLMGYSNEEIAELKKSNVTYGDFLNQAPSYNPYRQNITGKICGIQIETITDDQMQKLRQLDKLVDWLAKGKTSEQVIAKYQG